MEDGDGFFSAGKLKFLLKLRCESVEMSRANSRLTGIRVGGHVPYTYAIQLYSISGLEMGFSHCLCLFYFVFQKLDALWAI